MISFVCECGARVQFDDARMGKKGTCPTCRRWRILSPENTFQVDPNPPEYQLTEADESTSVRFRSDDDRPEIEYDQITEEDEVLPEPIHAPAPRRAASIPIRVTPQHQPRAKPQPNAAPIPRGRSQTVALGYARRSIEPTSYVGKAWFLFFLYMVPIVGLVAFVLNFMWIRDAKWEQAATGVSPRGKGCLIALIWWTFWIPLMMTGAILIMVLILYAAQGVRQV